MPPLSASMRHLGTSARALARSLPGSGSARRSLGHRVHQLAQQAPHRSAILFEDRHYSYLNYNSAANRVASVLTSMGLSAGHRLVLCMDTRPELLFSLVAASKLGVVSTALSGKAAGDALQRAVVALSPRALVVGAAQLPRIQALLETWPLDPSRVLVWSEGRREPLPRGMRDLNRLIRTASAAEPRGRSARRGRDLAMYVPSEELPPHFAAVRNQRPLQMGAALGHGPCGLRRGEVGYLTQPLGDSMGALAAYGAILATGGTVALCRRFDPEAFWRDCHRYGAAWFSYSAEVVQALLEAPSRGRERSHQVRLAAGAGLTAASWTTFEERFAIPLVVEHYAASAGDALLWGDARAPGSLGRPPWGQRVARMDDTTSDVLRDHRGRLVRCGRGERGMLVARIDRTHHFDGYLDPHPTRGAVFENGFGDGEDYFGTGKLVRVREDGRVEAA